MIVMIIIYDMKFSLKFAFGNQRNRIKYYNSLIICGQKS